jgi:hypothetical protein
MAFAQLFNFKLIAITYAGFLPILPIATLFPLLFASTFLLIQQPGLKSTLTLAASAALCLTTGGYQLLYYSALFLSGYVLWQSFSWWRSGRRDVARRLAGGALVASLLSAGTVACILVPLLSESHLLSRSAGSYDYFLAGYTLTPRHLLTFLFPESFGPLTAATRAGRYLWEDVGYFGIVPLCLAVVGAIKGWRRRHVPFLVVGFALSLVLAMESPLLRWLYDGLPAFGWFRMPIRFVYLTGFFGIALAGVGFEATLARLRARGTPGRWVQGERILAVALLAIVGAEGVHYARRYVDMRPAAYVLPRPEFADVLARDATVFRIAPYGRDTLQPGWAAPLNLQLVSGNLPYNFKAYRTFLEMMETSRVRHGGAYAWADFERVVRRDMLDVLNVKYVLSYAPLDLVTEAGFQEVAHLESQPIFAFFYGMSRGDIYVYRNDRFLERAFWATEVVTAQDEAEMIKMMLAHDLRTTAIVRGEPGRGPAPLPAEAGAGLPPVADDQVRVVSSSGGHLALETHSVERRFLTISEVWHPGWQGFLDGKPLPLLACDLALLGAWIPAGHHSIVLRFRPMHFGISLAVTAASLLAWSVLLFACVRARRRDRSHRVP